MRRAPVAALVLLVCAAAARAADEEAQRAALERAQPLVTRALDALRTERGDEAAELLAEARKAAPGQPVITFDHGVALAAAGRDKEAREAYRETLQSGDASDEAAVRARHNLALTHLDAARNAVQLLATPGALESAVRAHGAPGGEPLTPETVTMLASQLRSQAVGDGLKNARSAIDLLRDAVRAAPGDADAVRNLVLAQRARRALEEEKRQQQQQENEQKGDEKNDADQKQDDQKQDAGGDQGDSEKQEGDQEQKPRAGDQQEQQGKEEDGKNGESSDQPQGSDAKQGEPRDLGREEAERELEQMLDAASLKARQVEQMRAARLRRGAVERDW